MTFALEAWTDGFFDEHAPTYERYCEPFRYWHSYIERESMHQLLYGNRGLIRRASFVYQASKGQRGPASQWKREIYKCNPKFAPLTLCCNDHNARCHRLACEPRASVCYHFRRSGSHTQCSVKTLSCKLKNALHHVSDLTCVPCD